MKRLLVVGVIIALIAAYFSSPKSKMSITR